MKDPSGAMQMAIHAKLVASSGIAALMGGTAKAYDKVPDPRPDPLIRIGDDQVVGNSNACADGWEVFVTIHTFSRDAQAPRPKVKTLMNLVAQAIGNDANPPAPAGYTTDIIELVQSRSYFEEDGLTAHGVQTFRYLLVETA